MLYDALFHAVTIDKSEVISETILKKDCICYELAYYAIWLELEKVSRPLVGKKTIYDKRYKEILLGRVSEVVIATIENRITGTIEYYSIKKHKG